MWKEYITVSSLDEAMRILARCGEKARIVAGATDLILELERGIRIGIETLVDITRIPALDRITLDDDDIIHLGPLVSHNACAASKLLCKDASPLARACWEVGAPQIRNRGTVAGNLITASPANDTITPLMALGAWVRLKSIQGERKVSLAEFYTGVRKTIMQPNEVLVDIAFPALKENQRGVFMKLALRRAQAISVVNVCAILTFDPSIYAGKDLPRIESAIITLGAVAPTIIHAPEAEAYLVGKKLNNETIDLAAKLASEASRPIDDLRGSAAYRSEMVRVMTLRGLRAMANGQRQAGIPDDPVLLWGKKDIRTRTSFAGTHRVPGEAICTNINGKEYTLTTGQEKTLLRLLREEAGLIGTKEGCAEGECGACTVYLDGKAVMACLVPAPRAHAAEIVTIEGLANTTASSPLKKPSQVVKGKKSRLHPVQEAFIQNGAVQCGYCTPGFIMSAAKLLEEKPQPTREEIMQAITGNLCRCTGYYKIVQAIENASKS